MNDNTSFTQIATITDAEKRVSRSMLMALLLGIELMWCG